MQVRPHRAVRRILHLKHTWQIKAAVLDIRHTINRWELLKEDTTNRVQCNMVLNKADTTGRDSNSNKDTCTQEAMDHSNSKATNSRVMDMDLDRMGGRRDSI